MQEDWHSLPPTQSDLPRGESTQRAQGERLSSQGPSHTYNFEISKNKMMPSKHKEERPRDFN